MYFVLRMTYHKALNSISRADLEFYTTVNFQLKLDKSSFTPSIFETIKTISYLIETAFIMSI